MISPERSLRDSRYASFFCALAGALLWLAAVPLVISHSLRWAGALSFVCGLMFVLRWQIACGPKIAMKWSVSEVRE